MRVGTTASATPASKPPVARGTSAQGGTCHIHTADTQPPCLSTDCHHDDAHGQQTDCRPSSQLLFSTAPEPDAIAMLGPGEPRQIVIVGQWPVHARPLEPHVCCPRELICLSCCRRRHHWLHDGLLPHPPPQV